MTLPAVAAVPNPTSASFGADAYAFTQWMAAFATELPPEIARLNTLGFGSYSATSTTSLTIANGAKTLTVEAGKGYAPGQAVVIAQTSSPTNYMTGQVTSYDAVTGALVVGVTATGGGGSAAVWAVSVGALVAGGGVSPDSIVTLTSGTSWTCPAGNTKARARMVGGGAGAGKSSGTVAAGCGSAGASCEILKTVIPGTSYPYSVGAAGAAATSDNTAGSPGGTTTMFGASAGGGVGGAATGAAVLGGSATGGDINVSGGHGLAAGSQAAFAAHGGNSQFGRGGVANSVAGSGYGAGGYSGGTNYGGSGAGSPGVIILELYK